MSWDTWRLTPIPDDAPSDALLEGTTRVFVRGVNSDDADTVEELSSRWKVTTVLVCARHEVPAVGSLVLVRRHHDIATIAEYLWGGPGRVVAVRSAERVGMVELTLLEDEWLNKRTPETDEYLLERIAVDRPLSEREAWLFLSETWRLMPRCLDCGGKGRSIVYGMPTFEMSEDDDLALMGCVVDEWDGDGFICRDCDRVFLTGERPLGARATVASNAAKARESALDFIRGARWQYARTMPDWPHEYTVKDWRPDDNPAFEQFCHLIRTEGLVEPWPPPPQEPIYRNRYLVLGPFKYWAMGSNGDRGPVADLSVINRAEL